MARWLVTGGAGFIGSNFVRHALNTHHDVSVVVLDKLTYAGNRENLADLDPKRYSFVHGDICDAALVQKQMDGIDVVFNFAAETHVDRSLLDASAFVRTDVEGTWVLLEAARKDAIRFVQISTDEVYGSRDVGSFTEDDVTVPRNPYAASKLGGERLAYSYFATHGLPVVIVRPSNNYGPYQFPEKLVPLMITNAILNRPLPVYGDGLNVRDWLFVEDNCRAIDLVAHTGVAGEVYNISGGNERPNREIVERIVKLLDKSPDLIHPVKDRVGHDRRYSIDGSKAQALGYQPKVSFEEGIERTVRWYTENEGWWRRLRDAEFNRYYERQYEKEVDMRLLVTGAGGILGQDLTRLAERRGHEVIGYDHSKLDVVDGEAVEATVQRDQPQLIVHCAAYTDVDGAESAEDEAHRVNADGAQNVARAALNVGARLIHVSTDYVFAGDEPLARRESDATDPLSAYGRSKLQGERAVVAVGGNFVVVRSAWLYGKGGRNFVDTIAAKAQRGEALKVVDDQIGSPTWAVSLALAILNTMETSYTGLLHFSNRGSVSWCGFARAIVEQLGLDVEVSPISSRDLNRKAPRPAHSILDTTLYEQLTGKAALPWREALQLYLSGMDDERLPMPHLDEV